MSVVMGVDCAPKFSGIAIMKGDKLLFKRRYATSLGANATDVQIAQAAGIFKDLLVSLVKEYDVDRVVVELTGVTRNANTMRLLCYFEAATILAAYEALAEIERIRTKSVRKRVFGDGAIDKRSVVSRIQERYGELSEDEAEAIVFALYGGGFEILHKSNGGKD